MTAKKLLAVCTFGFLVHAAPELHAKGLEEQSWIELQTESFRIRSSLKEKHTIELAGHLEAFRYVVSVITGSEHLGTPTDVLMLRHRRDYPKLGLSANLKDHYLSSLRTNTIVIERDNNFSFSPRMLHSYVRFLTRNDNTVTYPLWFVEGLAEYFGTAKFDKSLVTVGTTPWFRLRLASYYDRLPMRTILLRTGVDSWDDRQSSVFSAQSWELVHYLQNRPDRKRPLGQEIRDYVTRIESGIGPEAAFEATFGVPVEQLDAEVQEYLNVDRIPGLQLEIGPIFDEIKPIVRKIATEEISLALAQTAMQSNKFDSAERWFSLAMTKAPFQSQALAGLGSVLTHRSEYDSAQPYFEMATGLAPDDPICQLEYADYWHRRAVDAKDADRRKVFLNNAREAYSRAIALDDSQPDAYAHYAEFLMDGGTDYDKAVENLERARQLRPSNTLIHALLAEAYLGANQLADAERSARQAIAWSNEKTRAGRRAQKVLDTLAAAEQARLRH